MAIQQTGYSDAEIASAASSLVQGNVSVKRDPLGPVDLEAQFQEVVDLVTSTLVNDPASVFYLLYLLAGDTGDKAASMVSILQDMQIAIDEIANPTKPITNTTLLGDAAAALLEVNAILSKDDTIQKASYDRFIKSVDAFRDVSLRPNVTPSSGSISRSHPEAVNTAYSHLVELKTKYPEALTAVRELGTYLDTFMALDLRKASAQATIDSARVSLTAMQQTFEDPSTTDAEKAAEARSSYLQLAAAKALVKNVHLVKDPRRPKLDATSGSGATLFKNIPAPQYEETTAPFKVQGAVAVGKNGGPWRLTESNNQLTVAANGHGAITVTLPVPDLPEILSDGASTTYTFTDDTPARLVSTVDSTFTIPFAPTNVLTIIVNGLVYTCTFTPGSQTTADLLAVLNDNTALQAVLSTDTDGSGHLVFETRNAGDTAGIIVKNLGAALGFTGDNAFSAGTSYNRMLVIDGSQFVEMPVGTLSSSDVADRINTVLDGTYSASVFSDDKRIYIHRVDGYLKFTMSLPPVGGSFSGYSRETLARCFDLLGFHDGDTGYSPPVSALQIVETLNASEAFQALGVVAAVSKDVLVSSGAALSMSGLACTYPTGTQVRFPRSDVPAAFLDNYAASSPFLLSVEIRSGYNRSTSPILSVASQDSSYVTVATSPEFPYRTTEESAAFQVVRDSVKITSIAWDSGESTSKINISGSAANVLGLAGDYYGSTNGVLFFPEGFSIPAPTSSNFFPSALPLGQYGIKQGDLLWRAGQRADGVFGDTLFNVLGTLTEDDLSASSYTDKILVLELPGLSLRPATAPDPGWLVYSYESYYYRYFIESVYNGYLTSFWSASWTRPYASGSISELERVMNPLLVNPQPSVAQLNDARTQVANLLTIVLVLQATCSYVLARKVARIDAALTMLQERGFDLAYKALSTGDLVGFLAMDKDDASSSAAMLKAARAVAQNDVPVSKAEDDGDIGRTHQTTAYTPDASYDYTDVAGADAATLVGADVTIDADDPAADQVAGKTVSG